MAEIDPLNWEILSKEELKKIWGKETAPKDTKRLKKIREDFIQLLDEKIDLFLQTNPIRPTLLQEIPPMAKQILDSIDFPHPDEEYTTSKGNPRTFAHAKHSEQLVQLALTLAKKTRLMKVGDDLPLRRVWYAFIKATLERGLAGYVYGKGKVIGDPREPKDGDYTNAFSDIIKNTNLWYSDFGIKNPSATARITEPKYFPPILIGLEKRSYYDVLQEMSELLGFSIYSAGGQSKFAEQEFLAKGLKETIFDQYPEYNDLDIYIISDFDPAGIDIAINIAEHQKFYQERFGKTVNTERLAPLPEHYKRVELEQGLYTVKNPTRESWNYPEIKNQRIFNDDKGEWEIEKEKGLEVESLPDQPLENILKNPPTDWDKHDYNNINGNWKGLTRMRFILFDKLIEEYGLEQTFGVLLEDAAPEAYSLAEEYIDKDNFNNPKRQLSGTDDLVRKVLNKPSKWINDFIKSKKKDLEDEIQEWIDDIIEQFVDDSHSEFREEEKENLVEEIKNGLYFAISRNWSAYSIDFPVDFEITDLDGKEEEFMITIPEKFITNLKPIIDYSLCIAANIQEANTYIEELESPHMRTEKDEFGYEIKIADGKEMLSKEFKLPLIRQCESVKTSIGEYYPYKMTIDEVVWKKGTENGIEADCNKYRTQIRKLNDQIADLEWEYEKDIIELEKQIEEVPEEENQQEKIDEFRKIAEERLKKIAEMRTKENELKASLEEVEADYDNRTKQLQEAHKISLEVVQQSEKKIKELQEQLKAKPEVEKSAVEQYVEAKDLKQKQKEERQAKDLSLDPFRYWEETEINKPKIYKQRIQLYYSHTKNMPEAIQSIIDEKIGVMEKIYSKNYPKIEEAVGQEYTKQMSLLSGDLNRLNNDIKKLFHFGR